MGERVRMGFKPPIIPPRGDEYTIFNKIIINGLLRKQGVVKKSQGIKA
jgi:hypothetical protein